MVAHALTSLNWLNSGADFETVSAWLRAPYWSVPDFAARCRHGRSQGLDVAAPMLLCRRLLLPLPQQPEDEEFVLQHSFGNCSLLLALHRGLKLGHVAAPRAPVAI
jgi:hypothetical protein